MKLLSIILTAACLFPLVAQGASEDRTTITNHVATTPVEVQSAREKFPEINSQVGLFQVENGMSVVVTGVQWTEAFLAQGGVDQSNFADGYCGTNSHGMADVLLPDGRVDKVWFSHFNSRYCGFGIPQ
jgi:hypothetical protein